MIVSGRDYPHCSRQVRYQNGTTSVQYSLFGGEEKLWPLSRLDIPGKGNEHYLKDSQISEARSAVWAGVQGSASQVRGINKYSVLWMFTVYCKRCRTWFSWDPFAGGQEQCGSESLINCRRCLETTWKETMLLTPKMPRAKFTWSLKPSYLASAAGRPYLLTCEIGNVNARACLYAHLQSDQQRCLMPAGVKHIDTKFYLRQGHRGW